MIHHHVMSNTCPIASIMLHAAHAWTWRISQVPLVPQELTPPPEGWDEPWTTKRRWKYLEGTAWFLWILRVLISLALVCHNTERRLGIWRHPGTCCKLLHFNIHIVTYTSIINHLSIPWMNFHTFPYLQKLTPTEQECHAHTNKLLSLSVP